MVNKNFEISFNSENGTIKAITVPSDKAKMNWCRDDAAWGRIHFETDLVSPWRRRDRSCLTLVSFNETDTFCESIYESEDIRVSVTRAFLDNGNFYERYVIKNLRDDEFFLEHGGQRYIAGGDQGQDIEHALMVAGHQEAAFLGDVFQTGDLQINVAGLDGQLQDLLDMGIGFLPGVLVCVLGVVTQLKPQSGDFEDVPQDHEQDTVHRDSSDY